MPEILICLPMVYSKCGFFFNFENYGTLEWIQINIYISRDWNVWHLFDKNYQIKTGKIVPCIVASMGKAVFCLSGSPNRYI